MPASPPRRTLLPQRSKLFTSHSSNEWLTSINELFGDLGTDGEFALSSFTSPSPVSLACTQEATLLISGNVQHRRASFAIANEFDGDCPGTNNCDSVYDGTFTKGRAKE